MNSQKVCSYIDHLELLLVRLFKHKNLLITNDDTENIIGNINMNGDFYPGPLSILMSLDNVIEFLDWEYTDEIETMLNTMNKFVTKKEIKKEVNTEIKYFYGWMIYAVLIRLKLYLTIYNYKTI